MSNSKMSNHIANELIKEILITNQYNPKEKLPNERILCQNYNVSRQVIREALKILEAQGYLNIIHGSGSYVAEFPGIIDDPLKIMHFSSKKKIDLLTDWYTTRRIIESAAISMLIDTITDEDIKHIETRYNVLKNNNLNTVEFFNADRDFHIAIASRSNNIVLERCALHVLQSFYYNIVDSTKNFNTESLISAANFYHKQIFEFILCRDAKGAELAMRAHMNYSLKSLSELLDN